LEVLPVSPSRRISLCLALSLILSLAGGGCAAGAQAEGEPTPAQLTPPPAKEALAEPTPTPVPPTAQELWERRSFADIPADAPYRGAAEYMAYLGVMQGTGEGAFAPGQVLDRATAVTTLFRLSGDEAPAAIYNTQADKDTDLYVVVTSQSGEGYIEVTQAPTPEVTQAVVEVAADAAPVETARPSVTMVTDGPDGLVEVTAAPDRTGGLSEATETLLVFPDVSPEDWYADGVAWAVSLGIVNGYEDGTFRPHETLDRAQLAVILFRFLQAKGGDTAPRANLDNLWGGDAVPGYAREAMSWAVGSCVYLPLISAEIGPNYPVTRAQLAQALTGVYRCLTYDPLAGEIVTEQNRLAQSRAQANHAAIQAAVDAAAKKYNAMGVQVAVIEGGRVTDSFAAGYANRSQVVVYNAEDGSQIEVDMGAMTPDHKIRIASISKVVIGMAAMALSEDGIVDLDTSIGDYWGFPVNNPHASKPVSVRSIMTHTSSIPSYGDDESRLYAKVKRRLSNPGTFRNMNPGNVAGWAYNNYAFGVLGMTLELADHHVMDDIAGRYFFDPLEVDAAFESGEIQHTELLSTIYSGRSIGRSLETQKGLKLNPTPGATGQFFAGGLTISARDLAKLIATLANDGVYEGQRLLSAESVQTMETSVGAPAGTGFEQCQPLRLQHNIYGRDSLYYHTGSAYGVFNCFSYDPATGDGVVVLTTGARYGKDERGIYSICGAIMTDVYAAIAD